MASLRFSSFDDMANQREATRVFAFEKGNCESSPWISRWLTSTLSSVRSLSRHEQFIFGLSISIRLDDRQWIIEKQETFISHTLLDRQFSMNPHVDSKSQHCDSKNDCAGRSWVNNRERFMLTLIIITLSTWIELTKHVKAKMKSAEDSIAPRISIFCFGSHTSISKHRAHLRRRF